MLIEKLKILQEALGYYKPFSDEYLFFCPRCGHHKKKLSVNINLDKFQCWVCGYSGHSVSKLVKRFASKSQYEEWKVLTGHVDFSELFAIEEETEEIVKEVELPKEFIFLGNKQLPISSIEPRLFLKGRGVFLRDILKWKIGYCSVGKYAGRIIFPSFDLDGRCNFFVSRTYRRDKEKYINSEVSKDIIFNEMYVDWEKPVSIVEGVLDAISAKNAVPLLGSSLSTDSKLMGKLTETKLPVYVCLDLDAERKENRIIKNLMELGVDVRKVEIAPHKDVNELGAEGYTIRRQNARTMNSDSILMRMLEGIT
jgi:transcription elongation factor Elf1